MGWDKGHEGRYVTDFPAMELVGNSNVIAMPHLGASTAEAEETSAQMAADQVRDYLEHGIIVNSVNFPACRPKQVEDPSFSRMSIVNSNSPGVLAGATTALSEAGCNVTDVLSSSRNDIAYHVIDFDGNLTPALL